MRAPTEQDLKEMYWFDFDDFFYSNEEGDTVFSKATPKEVIDSYLLTHPIALIEDGSIIKSPVLTD